MRSLTIAGPIAVFAGACSGDPAPVDAGADDSSAARCLIPADYGAIGTKTGTPNTITLDSVTVVLDPGPPIDDFFLKLIPGNGVFNGGFTTGTFPIQGDDKSFATCGLCTNIIADVVSGQGPTQYYFATSGTVTLTATDKLAGSAQNLHFVQINGASGAPIAGGCTSTIASITFGPT
jgi:hypothetical protein